ncbi:ABC transporter substrate-binding protein [Rubellimicrobium aerolatum]|uniref:PotD/PotF family extracellular solute-binding protein n=1 Tax=Rubellimicrobium aerolatum TaxID=490979 RepID=A0ABW0SE94_9RHOB|nr:extracellular solute-binding protein [Rubellimicrobium aerolatum]MBP1806838.1 putative spermidine/putrescine transport system substrate-binding protein [Rubellimicrobium aerolatum]
MTMKRRSFLLSGVAGAAALAAPSLLRAQGTSLKVGTYGGYFQDSFNQHIFPDFTAETGIAVESIGEPTGEAWLVQLEQAARANQAPADVSMMSQVARLKGEASSLWAPLDETKLTNLGNLPEHFVHRTADSRLYGTGAVSWYITLVTNTEAYPEAPTTWGALWDPANADRIGLLALASNSFLLEITAATHFGGTDILGTEEGVMQVLQKLAEAKPNVRLWYRDEGQFQQALESGEIPMGQYYHDVTGLAAANGQPVRSTFPAEGAVLDSGSWVVSRASQMLDQSQVFIDYMARPEIQAKLSRNVGTAPTVGRDLLDLTDAEFAAVASDAAPILPRYDLYTDRADWVNQMWSEMITG